MEYPSCTVKKHVFADPKYEKNIFFVIEAFSVVYLKFP